jgi:hypothetical protein
LPGDSQRFDRPQQQDSWRLPAELSSPKRKKSNAINEKPTGTLLKIPRFQANMAQLGAAHASVSVPGSHLGDKMPGQESET